MVEREDPRRWQRRLISISLLGAAASLVFALLPILLLLALVRDLAVRSRLAWVRFALFVAWYLACECWGVVALFGMWLALPVIGHAGLVDRTAVLQRRWVSALTRAMLRLFSMRLEIEGADSVGSGPLLLLVRHASLVDTLLPIWTVSGPNRYTPRYVVKQELRWSPCLDIAGHRVPTYFVHRGEGAGEVERVAALADQLGSHDVVVLYPEGTRFSPARLERRLAELRERDDALLGLASEFRRCLPPRSGGVLGLIDRAPRVDVAILAHVGFERVRGLGDLLDGALIGRRIRVKLWRVPATQIPADDAGRRRWLYSQWLEVDRWIGAQLGDSAPVVERVLPEPPEAMSA